VGGAWRCALWAVGALVLVGASVVASSCVVSDRKGGGGKFVVTRKKHTHAQNKRVWRLYWRTQIMIICLTPRPPNDFSNGPLLGSKSRAHVSAVAASASGCVGKGRIRSLSWGFVQLRGASESGTC